MDEKYRDIVVSLRVEDCLEIREAVLDVVEQLESAHGRDFKYLKAAFTDKCDVQQSKAYLAGYPVYLTEDVERENVLRLLREHKSNIHKIFANVAFDFRQKGILSFGMKEKMIADSKTAIKCIAPQGRKYILEENSMISHKDFILEN